MSKIQLNEDGKHPLLGTKQHKMSLNPLSNSFLYKYYIKKGGKLSYEKYVQVQMLIFLGISSAIFKKGARIDVPFFGEMFIQETKLPLKQHDEYYKRNNSHLPEFVFQRFKHARPILNIYSKLELSLTPYNVFIDPVNGKKYPYKAMYDSIIRKNAVWLKNKIDKLKYVKSYKQKDDYVY